MSVKPIGLQLYSVREECEKDFVGTLKAVAEIGYKGVEFAGLHGKDPKEIAKIVADLGMVACSSHSPLADETTVGEIVEIAGILGYKHVVGGFGPDDMKTVDQVKECGAKFAKAAALLAPYNLTFSFHNHYWEFKAVEDGRVPYDIIMHDAPAVCSELDLYWIAFGGGDALKTLAQYGKRIKLVHVKDGLLGGEYHFAPAGAGQVDLPAYIKAVDDATEWMIVEQDLSDGDMLTDIRTSYNYLTSNGLAVGNK